VPKEPLFFLKPPSSVIASGDAIELPSQSKQVEHEGEIGLVIGKALHRVSPREAVDLQRVDSQWTRAKGFDTFCPIGEPGAVPNDLSSLRVVTRVNGEERQRGSASQMLFTIPDLLAYVSNVMTLEPGDVVATGTPSGVGILKAGDEVEVEIVGVSRVRNPVKAGA